MMRPFTCLSLVAALGAGLYLYQEKHGAQLLDREISRIVHQADQGRDRIALLKAEWALLNEPERLGSLAAQHLPLQPLQPAQYARMEDLRNRLPAIPPPATTAMDDPPAAPMAAPAAVLAPAAAAQVAAAVLPVPPAAAAPVRMAMPVQLAAVRPAAPKQAAPRPAAAKPREPEPAPAQALAASRPISAPPILAPVMPAYAPATVAVHAPTVQTASLSAAPQPFVGSALGMARTMLAAPVPVAAAATLGYAASR